MKIKVLFLFTVVFLSAPVFSSGPSLSCKVLPPGPNIWKSTCFTSVPGGPPSVTVEFRIDNAPANYYIDWKGLSCPSASLTCSTTIASPSLADYDATVIDLNPPSSIRFVQTTVSYIN